MFLLHCLGIVLFAYACGAVVAGVVLTSAEEKALPPEARALLGVTVLTVYFAAAWQLLSIDQSWILGLLLLLPHALGRRAQLDSVRAALHSHARGCAAVIAGAILFFAPLLVANTYGPFTEGSGDVTIYSDTTKLLTDGGMTAFGQPSPDLRNVAPNVKTLLDVRTLDRYVRHAAARDQYLADFKDRLDPPVADYAAHRLVARLFFSSIFYAPYAQFYFVSGSLNYAAFYAVQAFFYAGLLACMWHFFRPFGRAPASLALALVAASHSLVSVFYNAYSMHAISLAIFASMLLAVGRVPLATGSGLRVYGFGTLVVWLCYTHYMLVLAPLLLAAALASMPILGGTGKPPVATVSFGALGVARGACTAVFLLLLALLLMGGSANSLEFVSGLLLSLSGGERNVYLGHEISPLSVKWLWFLFGLVSQQHLQPFALEHGWVTLGDNIGVLAGMAAFALGVALLVRVATHFPREAALPRPIALTLYVGLFLTVALQMYLARSSLYTQAKGAQNVLIALYAALVLPFALAWNDGRFSRSHLRAALAISIGVLALAMLVPRAVYGYRIAQQADRAAIMERSFFDAARRIAAADPQAFVLFEPRASADLYLGIQPFAGRRMIPTRHLVLDRLVSYHQNTKKRVAASEFVTDADLPHLWALAYDANAQNPAWREGRLLDSSGPALVLLGDDYQRAFGPRPRSPQPGDLGTFSYVRNGDVLLMLPAGQAASVEARIEPRDQRDGDKLAQWLAGSAAPEAIVELAGAMTVLRRDLGPATAARLVRLAGFHGEYWVNVRVNGVELK